MSPQQVQHFEHQLVTQVDEESPEPRLSSRRRRLPPSRHELIAANLLQLEGVSPPCDSPSHKRSSSRRSEASSDTVRSHRSSTATSSYRYRDLAASEIHLHAEPTKDIEAAVNDIINSKVTAKRHAEINIIAQQFSKSCLDNVRACSGKADFIESMHTAIEALGFEHLSVHTKADWREDLKPKIPRGFKFSSNFMAVVDQGATEDASALPRKRRRHSSGAAPQIDPPGSSTMVPTTFQGQKHRSPLKTPCPDISMGIKLPALISALASQNLNAVKARQFLQWLQSEMVERDDSLEPMLITIPASCAQHLAIPFAVMEGQSCSASKQIFEAENQAAVSAACGLKIQLDLDDLVEHARAKASPDAYSASVDIKPPLFFSVCTQGPIHELWAHWTTVEDEVRMFQSKLVDSCNALLHQQAEDFLVRLNNLGLWGTGPFMESVVERLGIVAKLAQQE